MRKLTPLKGKGAALLPCFKVVLHFLTEGGFVRARPFRQGDVRVVRQDFVLFKEQVKGLTGVLEQADSHFRGLSKRSVKVDLDKGVLLTTEGLSYTSGGFATGLLIGFALGIYMRGKPACDRIMRGECCRGFGWPQPAPVVTNQMEMQYRSQGPAEQCSALLQAGPARPQLLSGSEVTNYIRQQPNMLYITRPGQ